MPSSKGPKIFHNRTSSPLSFTRKPTFKIFFLLLAITSLILFLVAISRTLFDQSCNSIEPKTVSVVYSYGDISDVSSSLKNSDSKKRHKVMAFVGIFTGFGSVGRRRSLRQTWLPSDRDGLQRYELF